MSEKDVHTEHCCIRHGCKYGDSTCTVTTGLKEQSYECEECSYEDISLADWLENGKRLANYDKLTQQVKDLEFSLDDRDCYIADADMKNEALVKQVAELRTALSELIDKASDDCGGWTEIRTEFVYRAYKALKESE